VPDPIIASSFLGLLASFSDCFTAPSFSTFRHIVSGWILCVGRHTTTAVIQAAGVVGAKHHTSFHRFFRAAKWCPDQISRTLLMLLLGLCDEGAPITFAIDDTLARHTGKRISSAGMHRDPLLSTAVKAWFHFGHVWVVLAMVIKIPRWNKTFALPVAAKLYRSEKVCKQMGIPHCKKTELARDLLALVVGVLPERDVVVVGDNAFANRTVLTDLPDNVCFVGRGIMNAAVFTRPWARRPGERGPARVRGERLATPKERAGAEDAPWQQISAALHTRHAALQVQVFDALWQKRGPGVYCRFVVIRGWPGHEKDDVLLCTDTSKSAEWIIETYCLRWSIEVTFHWAKSKLGLEDPQNRTEHAVLRTAPMALWCYSLVVYWYLTVGESLSPMVRAMPWYTKKAPAFSDMLAALRRESWRSRIVDRADRMGPISNELAPLIEAVSYG